MEKRLHLFGLEFITRHHLGTFRQFFGRFLLLQAIFFFGCASIWIYEIFSSFFWIYFLFGEP